MQPMLAATVERIEQLDKRYPLLASPKLDGIRAIVVDGEVVSRNLKRIPNAFVQRSLPLPRIDLWDGELVVGKPEAKDCFRTTTSGVMSEDGEPNFTFWVFDSLRAPSLSFWDRFTGLKANVKTLVHARVKLVPQVIIKNAFELQGYEQQMLDKGFEGVMLRSPNGIYKHGRSTFKEGHLMKLKRFMDSEAEILELVEQMENTNEKKLNELGKMKRSSHKAGKVGKATLGVLVVRDIKTGVQFDLGTGLDDKLRLELWRKNPKNVKGKIVKYKYFPTGSKDKPRFPVFLGFRDKIDL